MANGNFVNVITSLSKNQEKSTMKTTTPAMGTKYFAVIY